MSRELRYYQEEALEAMTNAEEGSINCIRMACGTGKTLIIWEYLRRLKPRIAVIVFPRLALIEQYTRGYGPVAGAEYITVGSIEGGLSATRDDREIKRAVLKTRSAIILTTYISIVPLAKILQDYEIDVVIYDESHHTNTDEQDVAHSRLDPVVTHYFTATPVDNHKNIIYEYSYDQALQDGYSRPFVISIYVTAQPKTPESIYEMLGYFATKHGLLNTLCFHKYSNVAGKPDGSSVDDFVDFDEEGLDDLLPSNARIFCLKGETPIPRRIQYLEEARNPDYYTILHTCNTVSEGVDTQGIASICMVDEKSSTVAVTQAIGRIMRKDVFNPDTPSYLLVPFFDCEGTNGVRSKDKILGAVIDTDLQKRAKKGVGSSEPAERHPRYVPPPNDTDEVDLALLERNSSVETISGIMSFFARDAPESTRAAEQFSIEELHQRVSAFSIEAHHNDGIGTHQTVGRSRAAASQPAQEVYGTNMTLSSGQTSESLMSDLVDSVIEQYENDIDQKRKTQTGGLYEFLAFFSQVVANNDTRYKRYPDLETRLLETFGEGWEKGIYVDPTSLDDRIADIINWKRFGFPILLPDIFNKKWKKVRLDSATDKDFVQAWVNRRS